MTNQVLPAQGALPAHSPQQAQRIENPFDAQLAAAKEGAVPETPQQQGDAAIATDADLPADEGQEGGAEEEMMAALACGAMNVIASWVAPLPDEAQAPAVVIQGELAAMGQPQQTIAPVQVQPADEGAQDAQSPEQAQPPVQQSIDILEGTADEAVTDPNLPERADGFMHQLNRAADKETAAQAKLPVVEEPSARMPEPVVLRGEGERKDAARDPSSLENVDDRQDAPPPSRLEITQVVRGSAQAEPPKLKAQQPEAEGLLPAQQTVAQADPGAARIDSAPVPAIQIADEIQIQQAMGRSHFTLRLNPESLGEVTVRLAMVGEGVVARIITRTEGARAAIANEVAVLGESMRERGIDVRSIQVLDGSMSQTSLLHDGRQSAGGWNGRREGRANRPATPVEAADAAQDYESEMLGGLSDDSRVELRA